MTLLPPGVKVHLALGYVDMRKGIDGLAMLVQGVLRQDPFSGHLFVFRGRSRANLIKIVFWDGSGLCRKVFPSLGRLGAADDARLLTRQTRINCWRTLWRRMFASQRSRHRRA
jgi:hypothetical protein